MDKPPLSELCATCHAEKPKYRCPRCKAQTCSLACYKRHQQRASCNGQRDPTLYKKKSHLATPAGIDQDYNYLKHVESTIDSASRGLERHDTAVSRVETRAWQRESKLQQYMARNNITVQLAPKGMSRQKANQTRSTKAGNIMWTVEWIDASGNRELQNDCLASDSITKLYVALQTQRRNTEKRRSNISKVQTSTRGTKRKRNQAGGDHHDQVKDKEFLSQQKDFLHRMKSEEQAEIATVVKSESRGTDDVASRQDPTLVLEEQTYIKSEQKASERQIKSGPSEEEEYAIPKPKAEELDKKSQGLMEAAGIIAGYELVNEQHESSERSSSPVRFILERKNVLDPSLPTPNATQQTTASETPSTMSDRYYYLHKPGTRGAARVLIPLNPEASLTESLQDQVVQEYPTIYVLPEPSDWLPAGFLLEKEYRKIAPFSGNPSSTSTRDAAYEGDSAAAGIDAARGILDMLKRVTTA